VSVTVSVHDPAPTTASADLVLIQGQAGTLDIVATDDDGKPLDLADATLRFVAKEHRGDADVVFDLSGDAITIDQAEGEEADPLGTAHVAIAAADWAMYPAWGPALEWALEGTIDDDDPVILAAGEIAVTASVIHDAEGS
jgi:hypothetical protein